MADGKVESDYECIERLLTRLNELTTASIVIYQLSEEQGAEIAYQGNWLACERMVENAGELLAEQVNEDYPDDEEEEYADSE